MLKAVVIEETPGTGTVLIPNFIHSLINSLPGSDNVGVPASDIKDKILPSLKYLITLLS